MRVSRLLVDGDLAVGSNVQLDPAQAHYVRTVLRLRSGQLIRLFDGKLPRDFIARLQVDKKQVIASIESVTEKHTDSPFKIRIIQGFGRSEHNDWVVQKGCELGASEFMFFNAQRTQSPLKGKRLEKKLSHWQAIARSACEQCNRNQLPTVRFTESLAQQLHFEPAKPVQGLVLDFNGVTLAQIQPNLSPDLSCYVLVGPEGGLTDDEVGLAQKYGFYSCSLGPRILRMETAAISAITLLQHYFADM